MKRWLIGLLFLVTNAFAQPPMITKVIELHYQNAERIVQLIQPILQDGEQISGSGQTLIVKVSPATLTQLRAVLHKLDQPPVTFEITVFQGDPDWLSTENDNTISISTSSQRTQQRRQSVQVMNGESAFVSTGQDQPVISSVGVGFWNTGISYDRRLVQNGLLVEPVLQGQRVKLTVRRVREQDSQVSNQQFDEQQVDTTVMVPLNQWVSLASAQGGAPVNDSNTITIHAGDQFVQNSTLYIKVTIVGKTSSNRTK